MYTPFNLSNLSQTVFSFISKGHQGNAIEVSASGKDYTFDLFALQPNRMDQNFLMLQLPLSVM